MLRLRGHAKRTRIVHLGLGSENLNSLSAREFGLCAGAFHAVLGVSGSAFFCIEMEASTRGFEVTALIRIRDYEGSPNVCLMMSRLIVLSLWD